MRHALPRHHALTRRSIEGPVIQERDAEKHGTTGRLKINRINLFGAENHETLNYLKQTT